MYSIVHGTPYTFNKYICKKYLQEWYRQAFSQVSNKSCFYGDFFSVQGFLAGAQLIHNKTAELGTFGIF